MSVGRQIIDLCSAFLVPPHVRVIEFVDGMMPLLTHCVSITGSIRDVYTIRFVTGDGEEFCFETKPRGAAGVFRMVLARLAFFASEHGGGEFDPYEGEREFCASNNADGLTRVHLVYSNVNRAPFSFTLSIR